jgi:hydrogenase expression/formation protein HypC
VVEVIEPEPGGAMRMGKVEFGGILKDICLAYLPEVEVGDFVLVHVGFAISRIDEREAAEIFAYIEQIGEISELGDPFEEPRGDLAGRDVQKGLPDDGSECAS